MTKRESQISRRDFLKTSAALSVGALAAPYMHANALAATRDRVTVYQNTQADSINPYKQSSGSIYGNWQHVIEPLIELDYAKKAWVGVLAESWEFQGKRWVFKLRKGVKFHNGAPLTSISGVVFQRFVQPGFSIRVRKITVLSRSRSSLQMNFAPAKSDW